VSFEISPKRMSLFLQPSLCGREPDPLMVESQAMRAKPLFRTGEPACRASDASVRPPSAFYSPRREGNWETWIRTPGARNPHQRIEILEPFSLRRETLPPLSRRSDKFVQRGKTLPANVAPIFGNEKGRPQRPRIGGAALILPGQTRADVLSRFRQRLIGGN